MSERKRVVFDLRIKAVGAPKPDGTVTVSVGRRTVEAPVVAGRARVVVRGAKRGTRPVVVSYSGTDVVQAAVTRSKVTIPR